jgi:hypothetical protein
MVAAMADLQPAAGIFFPRMAANQGSCPNQIKSNQNHLFPSTDTIHTSYLFNDKNT